MIGITLRQLRYFEALARHRHFGRAAADCAISQPALSLQIKELEALFGVPLVERSARTLRLTPVGADLLVLGLPRVDGKTLFGEFAMNVARRAGCATVMLSQGK